MPRPESISRYVRAAGLLSILLIWATGASASDKGLRLRGELPSSVIERQLFKIKATYENTSTLGGGPLDVNGQVRVDATAGVDIKQVNWGNNACVNKENEKVFVCDLGFIAADTSVDFEVSAIGTMVGPQQIKLTALSNLSDPNPANDQIVYNFDVEPALALKAFVRYDAAGPGVLGSTTEPFNSLSAAFGSDADVILAMSGVYDESVDVKYTSFTKQRSFGSWSGQPFDSIAAEYGTIEVTGGFGFGNGNVVVLPGVDTIRVGGMSLQDTRFEVAMRDTTMRAMKLEVSGDFDFRSGSFFGNGFRLGVGGNYTQGLGPSTPSAAEFSLGGGKMWVGGNFAVAPNLNDSGNNAGEKNRFFLGGGSLKLRADYSFAGVADRWNDDEYASDDQGFDGKIVFRGYERQNVFRRDDPDTYFNKLVLENRLGINLASDLWINRSGSIRLHKGNIYGEDVDVVLAGRDFETGIGPSNRAWGGIIRKGGRRSFIATRLLRVVKQATGDLRTNGYLFGVGSSMEERPSDAGTGRDVNIYAPIILQTGQDLTTDFAVGIDYRPLDDPHFGPGLQIPDSADVVVGDSTIRVNEFGQDFWTIQTNAPIMSSFDIRLGLSSAVNFFDPSKINLVRFDCEGHFVGGFGSPVVSQDDTLMGFRGGTLNLTFRVPQLETCQIIGLASRHMVNPIASDTIGAEHVPLQFFNFSGQAVDVWYADRPLFMNVRPNSYSPTFPIDTLGSLLAVRPMGAPPGSAPLYTGAAVSPHDASQEKLGLLASWRDEEIWWGTVPYEPPGPNTLRMNTYNGLNQSLTFDYHLEGRFAGSGTTGFTAPNSFGSPIVVPDTTQRRRGGREQLIQLDARSSGDEILAAIVTSFFGRQEASLTAVVGESPGGKSQAVDIMVGEFHGEQLDSRVVTSVARDATEIPATTLLMANFPNPFSNSTTIEFELPRSEDVQLDVFDVMGRRVTRLIDESSPGGRYRIVWDGRGTDGSRLPSGTYFYRLRTATIDLTKPLVIVR